MRRLMFAVMLALMSYVVASAEALQLIYPADCMYQGWEYYAGRTLVGNHLGADIDLPEKTPVRAVLGGKLLIWRAQHNLKGYGELVAVIESELPLPVTFTNALEQLVTTKHILLIYGHMRKSQERDGTPLSWKNPEEPNSQPQYVRRGDIIGYVNNSSHPVDLVPPDPNGDGFEHLHLGLRLSDYATASAADPGYWFRGYIDGSPFAKDFANAITFIQSNLVSLRGTLIVIDNPGPHPRLVVDSGTRDHPPIVVVSSPNNINTGSDILRLTGINGATYTIGGPFLRKYQQIGGVSTLGVPLGDKIGNTWRFDRGYLQSDGTVVRAFQYDGAEITASMAATFTIATTGGDGTVALDAPAPAPVPDPVIPLANVRLVIQPAESGYRYQLARGQERMNFVLRLDHTGGNAPLAYRFYDGATLIAQGANPFCEANLGSGNHAIRARVEAGSGNNLRSSEASQAILVEAAPKSDWGVPFEAKISTITNDGTYVYVAGVYVSGPNAGKGFLRRISRSNPAEGQSYTFGFSFNEILPRDSYLFAATSNGLMVSRDQGATWSTLYSNGQAYSIAILPGDKWNDWPIMILVGCAGGNSVIRGFWTPSEPNTLSNLLGMSGLGPYTLVGGRRGNREWVFVVSSGPSGVQTQTGPYHLAYTNSGGRLQVQGAYDGYAGQAWTIFAWGSELLVALKTNVGNNVYYNDDYGGSSYQKARGIPSGDDVVGFAWINSISGITRRGALYHAPDNPTQWRTIAGFSGELKLDLAAGQLVTCVKRVGQDAVIGTERGLRVIPVARIATLAAAKPVGTDEQATLANTSGLLGNYPNPFNSETVIRFRLPEAQHVRLCVYTITGSLVSELANELMPAGIHAVTWEGARHGNGVYLCVLEAGVRRDIRKITLLK